MYIEFESNQTIDNDFSNNKIEGARWFTRSQTALMFKEGSKYPDKFELNLSFSNNKADQQAMGGFSAGRYELTEDAYGFDNRRNPVVDFTKLRSVKKGSSVI